MFHFFTTYIMVLQPTKVNGIGGEDDLSSPMYILSKKIIKNKNKCKIKKKSNHSFHSMYREKNQRFSYHCWKFSILFLNWIKMQNYAS